MDAWAKATSHERDEEIASYSLFALAQELAANIGLVVGWRQILLSLLLMPLWASYIAKVYAWINILSNKGVLSDLESHLGLPISHIVYSNTAMWIIFSYLWLPLMIVPNYGAL